MQIASNLSDTSLERLVPDSLDGHDATGQETYELHLARYNFAAQYVTSGPVLDCACGVGYGTAILADAKAAPASVKGVDIDPAAAEYAAQRYAKDNISFHQGDGALLDDPVGFDTIVSLETIEHVPDPVAILTNFERLLRPGGILIGSVPVTPSVDVNPFHLHDFTIASFRKMGKDLGLEELDMLKQNQPFDPFKIVTGKEARLDDMRQNMVQYYLQNPASFLKRCKSTLFDGFNNKYLTMVWKKPA